MALIWTVKITNVDLTKNKGDVSFDCYDDAEDITEHFSYRSILETTEQRLALLDKVWNDYLDRLSERTNIEAFISNLEQSAKANLEAREV